MDPIPKNLAVGSKALYQAPLLKLGTWGKCHTTQSLRPMPHSKVHTRFSILFGTLGNPYTKPTSQFPLVYVDWSTKTRQIQIQRVILMHN